MNTLDLIRRAANGGDPAASSQLVDLLYPRLYAFLRRLCGSEDEACDLTQKTFVRIWQSLESFQAKSSLASWAHSIAYRTYVDWLRTRRPIETASDAWWESVPASEPDPGELAARFDQANRVFAVVDTLDTDLKATVHLHYYQGLSLQETADAMGVATSTVKYRLRQALDSLRAGMESRRVVFAESKVSH